MKYLLLFLLPIITFAGDLSCQPNDFKEQEVKCLQHLDKKKIMMIANQLEVWDMRKANREIILALIVSDLTLECLEKALTNK